MAYKSAATLLKEIQEHTNKAQVSFVAISKSRTRAGKVMISAGHDVPKVAPSKRR